MIIMYSKVNCPMCDKTKYYLKSRNIDFTEMLISENSGISTISLVDFKKTYPMVKAVPYMTINSESIGGYNELIKMFI